MKHTEEELQRLIETAIAFVQDIPENNVHFKPSCADFVEAVGPFIPDPLEELKRTGCVLDEDEIINVASPITESYAENILAACAKKAGEVFGDM
jgi:hypothetical protein